MNKIPSIYSSGKLYYLQKFAEDNDFYVLCVLYVHS